MIALFSTALLILSCAAQSVHREAPLLPLTDSPRRPSSGEVLTMPTDGLEIAQLKYETFDPSFQITQRVGMFPESKEAAFKGCVMYLEGFGDSIQNHYPLFNKLRLAGYRVISFDYQGQGGSEGSMNDVRLLSDRPEMEIGEQAKRLWDFYSRPNNSYFDRTCKDSKKRVIGWSTGGLAAYILANQKWADTYVLINPALTPRLCVGESASNCLANLVSSDIVSERTLTGVTRDPQHDMHLDPVKPTSAIAQPLFVTNLITSAFFARTWKIDPATMRMLVMISPHDDLYVDGDKLTGIFVDSGAWYRLISYEDGHHELDNDMSPKVFNDVHRRIIDFLDAH